MPRPKTWRRRGKPHTSACALCMSAAPLLQTSAVTQRSELTHVATQCLVPLFPAACCGTCTACIRYAASLSFGIAGPFTTLLLGCVPAGTDIRQVACHQAGVSC